MNKSDFLLKVRDNYIKATGKKITVYNIEPLFDVMVKTAVQCLKEDGEFKLRDIISMEVKYRERRGGYNPDSGERIVYRPKNGVFCKVGRQFIKAVNEGRDIFKTTTAKKGQ